MARRILIITAMESEAKPICELLSLTLEQNTFGTPAKFKTYTGVRNESQIMLAWNGTDSIYGVDNIGTQPSVLTTFLCIKEFKPDIVINVGTAGGLGSQGTTVNDIFISKAPVIYHGRRIALSEFVNYGIGSYPALDAAKLAGVLGIKEGIVTTGDSFDHDEKEVAYICKLGGNVIEMEAAAIAWVCSLYGVPFMALKLVVNLVDGPEPAHEEFLKNLEVGCHQLKLTAEKLIDYISKYGN